jgi:hypothetical protein
MTSDQFHMTSDQCEKDDDQNWSQKPQDPIIIPEFIPL